MFYGILYREWWLICIYIGVHMSAETDGLNNHVSAGSTDRSSATYK